MQTIAIQAIPSQTFTYIDPESNTWTISIRAVGSQMAFSFALNGVDLIDNVCAVAGYRIIPYNYLQNGNFLLVTQNFQVPNYTQFGITQTLVFLEPGDITAAAAAQTALDTPVLTAASFDPNGGLPLRFAPVGYTLAS